MSVDRELDRLARFLARPGPRFGLAIAICADLVLARGYRARLIADSNIKIATVEFQRDDERSDLAARIIDAAVGVDAVFVVGLDRLVTDNLGNVRTTSAVANLNQRRDELPNLIDARVVFWVSKAGYAALTEVAWDLCQVMLTTAEFEEVGERKSTARTVEVAPSWLRLAELGERPMLERQLASIAKVVDAAEDARSRVDAAAIAGELAIRLGRTREGVEWYERAAAAAIAAGERREAAAGSRRIAQLRIFLGELDGAGRALELALEYADSERERALAELIRAELEVREGASEAALERLHERCLPAFERSGDKRSQAETWGKIADIHELRGDLDRAIEIRELEQLPLQVEDEDAQALTRSRIAGTLLREGKRDAAREVVAKQIAALERLDSPVQQSAMVQLSDLVALEGEVAESAQILAKAEAIDGSPRDHAIIRSHEAERLAAGGHHEEALAIWREVLPVFVEIGDARAQTSARIAIAGALVELGRAQEARALLEREVVPVLDRLGDPREAERARALLSRALEGRPPANNRGFIWAIVVLAIAGVVALLISIL